MASSRWRQVLRSWYENWSTTASRYFHRASSPLRKAWKRWKVWQELALKSFLVLFTCGCLLVIITFSLISKEYPLRSQYSLIGYQLEPETLLQFVGGINKLMDVTVDNSISFLSAAYLSFGIRGKGAAIADFDLADCMTNPLKALYTIPRCCRQDETVRRRCRSLKVIVQVVTSVCFILLPISVNTLLMPKLIWHPLLSRDGFPQTKKLTSEGFLITPMVYVSGISWQNQLVKSSSLLGETKGSIRLIATQIFDAFYDLPMAFSNERRDWYTAKRYPNTLTSIDTTSSKARAATVRAEDVQRLWQESETYGPSYAKHAVGFWGYYNVSTPTVEVFCESNQTDPTPEMGSIQFHSSLDNRTAITKLDLGSLPSMGFEAHTCSIVTRHALYSVGAWSLSSYDAQLNTSTALLADSWSEGYPPFTFTYTSTPQDFTVNVHNSMISMLQTTHPFLPALTSTLHHNTNSSSTDRLGDSFLQFLLLAARHIQSQNQDYTTSASALSHILAFWAQTLITLSDWHLTTDPASTKTSGPNWYQVYAAGPRLRWEFAILLVPSWLFTVLFVGVFLTGWKRVKPLACTDVAGMFFVQKSSSCGFGSVPVEEELEREMYTLRVKADEDGALEVVPVS